MPDTVMALTFPESDTLCIMITHIQYLSPGCRVCSPAVLRAVSGVALVGRDVEAEAPAEVLLGGGVAAAVLAFAAFGDHGVLGGAAAFVAFGDGDDGKGAAAPVRVEFAFGAAVAVRYAGLGTGD
jgi:hypothetical protein